MTAKAAKLRIKRSSRGRPRKEDAERHPCGKIKQDWSKTETERETQSVAIEARRRVHNIANDVPDAVVKSQLTGSVLGRMFQDGQIDEEQRKAGEHFAEVMARYYGMTGIPFPSARAQSLFSVGGYDGDVTDDMAARARRATNRMMEMLTIVQSVEAGPHVRSTMINVCLLDLEHLRKMPQQQVILLRRGLTAVKNAIAAKER